MSVGFDFGGNVGQRIIDLQPLNTLSIEPGLITPDQARRVAVIAGWCPSVEVTLTHRRLVEALTAAGYATLLVLAVDDQQLGQWPADERPTTLTIVRRPNVGYDFGSWAIGLHTFPRLRSARNVLLLNDSLVGPFASLETVVKSFEGTRTDVWGLSESAEIRPHLQSFWLGFRRGVLADRALTRFWDGIAIQESKSALIKQYEIGLTAYLRAHGYSYSAMFPVGSLVKGVKNPSQFGWKRMLNAGVPMVKRELLKHPEITPDSATIPEVLKARFGVDISEWN